MVRVGLALKSFIWVNVAESQIDAHVLRVVLLGNLVLENNQNEVGISSVGNRLMYQAVFNPNLPESTNFNTILHTTLGVRVNDTNTGTPEQEV